MQIVRPGAMCDVESISETSSNEERGFALGRTANLRQNGAEALRRSVLTTILPDDDESGEQHPWIWLCHLLHEPFALQRTNASAEQAI